MSYVMMSEMFEISEDGLVTIAASTMLGKNPPDRPKSSRANLINTLDKEERYKKDSSLEALISASTSESEKDFYLHRTVNGLSKFMERNLGCTAREYLENRRHGNRTTK